MGGVRRQRKQERDRRSGRSWAVGARNSPAPAGPEPAAGYSDLVTHLARLRTALAADRFTARTPSEVQHDQTDLRRSLSVAVARAFAADAHGAPVPDGISTWAGEGLARSDELELLVLASSWTPTSPPSATDLPYSERWP